jgi:hypothetical protein
VSSAQCALIGSAVHGNIFDRFPSFAVIFARPGRDSLSVLLLTRDDFDCVVSLLALTADAVPGAFYDTSNPFS